MYFKDGRIFVLTTGPAHWKIIVQNKWFKKMSGTINDSVWKYILKQCVKNIANCLATLEVPQYFFQNTTPNKLSYKKHFYQQVKCSSIIFLSA